MADKTSNEPHVRRENDLLKSDPPRGWLRHGNPPGDLSKVKRCNAKSKRHGGPCAQPAMANGKCRFHGGKSTGPRTPQGLARSRQSNLKAGEFSAEARRQQREMIEFFRML